MTCCFFCRGQTHDPFQWNSFISDLLYASHHPWTRAPRSVCEEAGGQGACSYLEAGPPGRVSSVLRRHSPSGGAVSHCPGSSPWDGKSHGLSRRPFLRGSEFPRLPGGPLSSNRVSPQVLRRPQSGDAGLDECSNLNKCAIVPCNADGGPAEAPTLAGKRGSHTGPCGSLQAPPPGLSWGTPHPAGPQIAALPREDSSPHAQAPIDLTNSLSSDGPSPSSDPPRATALNGSPQLSHPTSGLPQPGGGFPLARSPSPNASPLRTTAQTMGPPAGAQGLPLPGSSPTLLSDDAPPQSGVAVLSGRARPSLPVRTSRPQPSSAAWHIGASLMNGPSQGSSPSQRGRGSGLSQGRKRTRDGSFGLSQGASPAGKAMRQATLPFGRGFEGKSGGATDPGWKGVNMMDGEPSCFSLASIGPRQMGEWPAWWLGSVRWTCATSKATASLQTMTLETQPSATFDKPFLNLPVL